MKKTEKIFLAGLFFAFGIVAATMNILLAAGIWLFIAASIVVVRRKFDAAFLLLTFSFGVFYILIRSPSLGPAHISNFVDKKLTFSGIIVDEPEKNNSQQKLVVAVDRISLNQAIQNVDGKILLNVKSAILYEYGDKLLIECSPELLATNSQWVNEGIFSQCNFPAVKLIAKNQASLIKFWLFRIKSAVIEKINLTMRAPHSSLLAGILIGARDNLPSDLSEDFKRAGIVHVVAMSGYNITVVSAMIMNLFLFLYVRRQYAFWFAVAGIFFFMLLTGMSASVVRAGIMGVIVLLAKQLGQIARIKNILIVTLVAMLLIDPLVWRNIGFQLSFLSTIGLIYVSPKIYRYFLWIPERLACRDNVVSSLSAILLTLPLTIFYFGRFSIVALAVNFLVLSVIPLIMLLGFIQLNIAFVSLVAAKIVGVATFVLLDYVIRVAHVYASLPWAVVQF
jgi:competence protein ComEC